MASEEVPNLSLPDALSGVDVSELCLLVQPAVKVQATRQSEIRRVVVLAIELRNARRVNRVGAQCTAVAPFNKQKISDSQQQDRLLLGCTPQNAVSVTQGSTSSGMGPD